LDDRRRYGHVAPQEGTAPRRKRTQGRAAHTAASSEDASDESSEAEARELREFTISRGVSPTATRTRAENGCKPTSDWDDRVYSRLPVIALRPLPGPEAALRARS